MTGLMSSTAPLYRIPLSVKPAMPRSQIELDEFRDEIERRIALKHTQPEILN